jgi:hypothetical protein
MPIDPRVREALEQRGVELVRAYLIEHRAGRSSVAVPGVPMATRHDAEEWLHEKEQQRDKRERSDRRWLRITAIAAVVAAVAAMAAAELAWLAWAGR